METQWWLSHDLLQLLVQGFEVHPFYHYHRWLFTPHFTLPSNPGQILAQLFICTVSLCLKLQNPQREWDISRSLFLVVCPWARLRLSLSPIITSHSSYPDSPGRVQACLAQPGDPCWAANRRCLIKFCSVNKWMKYLTKGMAHEKHLMLKE